MSEQTQVRPASGSEKHIGHVDSIPAGEGRTFIVGDQRIAVFRSRAGKLYATQAECTHRGGPLADGIVAGTNIVCPLHEFRFEMSTGSPVGNTCDRLKTYPVQVDAAGEMTVLLEPQA